LDALLAVLGLAAGGVGGVLAGQARRRRRREEARRAEGPEREASRLREEGELERRRVLREAEIAAREAALARRGEAEVAGRRRLAELADAETALEARRQRLEAEAEALADFKRRLLDRQAPIAAREAEREAHLAEAQRLHERARATLEKAAGQKASAVSQELGEQEREEARTAAAHVLRQITEEAASPEHPRRAKRIMGIAVGRFSGHYLTERHLSLVPLPVNGKPLLGDDELRAIEAVAGVKLTLTDAADAVRLEGLDGVGREVARRCLTQIARRHLAGAAVTQAAREISAELDGEIADLGRRAFSVLEIPAAHGEIVRLVGRLNYRTSYTQNQWKHAVEAAFLCGMMADELRLDRKLARRAALMHDIGKALTHELDGSHAVIGADYARRLGEAEVVANAIGAHHTDEPFSSAYAYLVAAADAMSGARPRRPPPAEDNHMAKLADLERLSRGFPGVEEAFAVQGGREVRVYVREDRVDDLGAVKLSSDIAETISREMTFPGQIKVTVIREFRAVETAS
jgi:ribonuclease Y